MELDLQVEMAVGKRDRQKAGCPQDGLRHLATIASRHRPRNPPLPHAALHLPQDRSSRHTLPQT
jgi:hypothetical protein